MSREAHLSHHRPHPDVRVRTSSFPVLPWFLPSLLKPEPGPKPCRVDPGGVRHRREDSRVPPLLDRKRTLLEQTDYLRYRPVEVA